ncbi:unnamed protein product [Mesocestoides corti]|uniref:HSA domain-containing protein n=1 Tax=Mesocestoides corti TaxID=53468 RepID=A0A0R3U4K8_MESCO|nr:unnamed protein product [Mesocestoides corti]
MWNRTPIGAKVRSYSINLLIARQNRLKMVNKRRTLKVGSSISKPDAQPVSSHCQRNILRLVLSNPNATQRDIDLLDLESSLISTPELPILTVDAFQINRCRQSDSPLPAASKSSSIHLPRFGTRTSGDKAIQHYVYIPHKHSCSSRHPTPHEESTIPERPDTKTEIAQEAKREASVLQQINKLAKQGLWSASRLPKVLEPERGVSHWDYLLDEVRWMAVDFREERKWKRDVARKLAYAARMYCLLKAEISRQEAEALDEMRRKGAALIAAMVRDWWSGISDSLDSMSLLAKHRQWHLTQHQNRTILAHLTDTFPNWVSGAISRSPPRKSLPPPVCITDAALEELDKDWLPPVANQSSSSSTSSSSFDSLVDLGHTNSKSRHYSWDNFAWGLQSRSVPAVPRSPPSPHDGQASTDSSVSSSLDTDKEDLAMLIAESELPLDEVLEPYISKGWKRQMKAHELPDSDCNEVEKDMCSSDTESAYQSTVNSLRHDATLPLRQLLPPGYQPISASAVNGGEPSLARRRQSVRRVGRPPLVNGGSPVAMTDEVAEDSEEREDEDTPDTDAGLVESSEDADDVSESGVSEASSLPTPLPEAMSPGELARRARGIAHWKTNPLQAATSKRLVQTHLPAFGPTCRVPFLPTQTLCEYCPGLFLLQSDSAVSWLSAAYAQRIPSGLVSFSPASADAELALAVHLGQLAVQTGGGGGDWGPHLVVCPRVLLSAWRARLSAVCPGLRTVCVVRESRGGTGRRLKRGLARGRVHICLTTYAALNSRPSRFCGVPWHVVILDQVPHSPFATLVHPKEDTRWCRLAPWIILYFRSQSQKHPHIREAQHLVATPGDPALMTRPPRDAGSASEQSSVVGGATAADDGVQGSASGLFDGDFHPPEMVAFLVHRLLQPVRQRVCIFAADLCAARTPHLKSLFALLTCSLEVDAAVREASLIKSEPGLPFIRNEVVRVLEPFLFRFEEDDDFECFVKEQTVSNSLTEQQRALHDQILTDKTCERAVKSGHLTDLLTCVSAGASVCVHPWLLCSPDEVQSMALWLAEDHKPSPAPLVTSLLHFDTPSAVLSAVRELRSDETSPLPLLQTSLGAPAHIRRRLVELLPSSEQLRRAFTPHSPPKRQAGVAIGSSPCSAKKPRIETAVPITKVGAPEPVCGLPFITRELFDALLLEESAKLAALGGVREVSEKQQTIAQSKTLPPSTGGTSTSAKPSAEASVEPISAIPSIDVKTRIHQLERQSQLARLNLEGYADWCSSATMSFIQSASRVQSLLLSGHPSSFSPLPFSTTASSLCSVVQNQYIKLPPSSSHFGVLCTRDGAIGFPPQLDDDDDALPSSLDDVSDRLYPLLPSSRWLSPHTLPRRLPQFLASSNKIQKLRSLLCRFVRSKPGKSKTRPRLILLITHRSTLLDLLESWLPGDPYLSSLACLRFPIDYLEPHDNGFWLDWVNAWPGGSRGPLLVLMHARSPSLSLAGLRAGPDTRVIVCDADWRTDVVDNLKLKFRCWSINGLVDFPPKTLPPLPPLRVYRLVTEAETGDSIEARLVDSPAVRLLPDSVFTTSSPASAAANSATSRRRPQPHSRVQPNIVQELVSCLRRRALWRKQGVTTRGPPLAPSESDLDEMTADDESDTASLFHNREPLDEALLNQVLEMYESPRDTQAWCSGLAESVSISTEIHACQLTHLEAPSATSNYQDPLQHTLDGCDLLTGGIQQPTASLEAWELNQAGWMEAFEAFESLTSDTDGLFFLPSEGAPVSEDNEPSPLPLFDVADLAVSHFSPSTCCRNRFFSVWSPLGLEEVLRSVEPTYPSTMPTLNANRVPIAASCTWGYESEPIPESDLPPLALTGPHFDPSNAAAAASAGAAAAASSSTTSQSGSSAVSTKTSTMSYMLKRSAAAALSARNSLDSASVGAVGGGPMKKRKLTGAAAMAARRAANAKAAAAAAAAARAAHLEGVDAAGGGSGTLDQFDHLSTASTVAGATTTAAAAAASAIVAAPTNTVVVAISPTHKVSVPRPFCARDFRLVAGVVGMATHSGGFNPAARIRRVASSARGGGVMAALNNPLVLSKYALPSAKQPSLASHRHNLHAAVSGLVSFKFGGASTLGHHQSASSAGCFNEGKPPDWSPYEEAGLLQCTTKLQNITISAFPHHQSSSADNLASAGSPPPQHAAPNFRLAEFFVNNFFPIRSYRSSRQCLLTYYRILSALNASAAAAASASSSSSTSALLDSASPAASNVDLLSSDDDKTDSTHPTYHHQHQAASSIVGRKVKNKLKSSLSASLLPTASSNLLGLNSTPTNKDDSGSLLGSPTNRLKGYHFYLYLQSLLCATDTAPIKLPSTPVTAGAAPDNQVVGLLRKCIREAIAAPPPHSLHHAHHRGTFGGASTGGGGGVGSASATTTAAMLMRAAAAAAAASTAPNSAARIHPTSPLCRQGTCLLIQHGDEHNIIPDTLITPAMVIKNKEEREARQRAEAAAAAASAAASSSNAPSAASIAVASASATATSAASSSVVPTARVHTSTSAGHHHPTIVAISGTGGGSLQRSTNLLPFSTATSAFGGVSGGPGATGAPTVFRYTTPSRQVAGGGGGGSPSTGILRRVGSVTSQLQTAGSVGGGGGGGQQIFAVTATSCTGDTTSTAQRLVAAGPGVTVVCSGSHALSSNPTLVRRGVTLTATGGGAGGVSFTGSASQQSTGGGVTVLAAATGARPGSVLYQTPSGSPGTSTGTATGITLLATGSQGLQQIIRPRQTVKPFFPNRLA